MEGTAIPESTFRADSCARCTFEVDPESGAGYLAVHDLGDGGVDFTVSVGEGIFLDFTRGIGLVGIEVLDPGLDLLRFFGLAE